jgi:hypothetical protein
MRAAFGLPSSTVPGRTHFVGEDRPRVAAHYEWGEEDGTVSGDASSLGSKRES